MTKYTQYKKLAVCLIIPQTIVTVVFFIWPAINALKGSLYLEDAFGIHSRFAGLKNFIDALSDPGYLTALSVTLVIAFFITLFTLTFGLLLAVLVNNCHKSQGVYKLLLLWPYAVAPAVAAMLWRFLFQPTIGWAAQLLHFFSIDFNYLTHPLQAIVVIIITASWQQLSYNFLFFLAALKAIPKDIIEASMIDGASGWQRFWQIIFPMISPTTFFLFIMNILYALFDTFGIIDVMTHGGPERSTTTLIYKIYKDGFIGLDPSGSSAQSVIMMIIVTCLILLQFRYLEKKVHYA